MLSCRTVAILTLLVLLLSPFCRGQQPLVEPFLIKGQLTEGHAALEKHLKDNPGDDQARFGLGVLQFMQSVEHLSQSWYQYGINDDLRNMAFVRMPVPENPNPQPVTYSKARAVLAKMIEFLEKSEQTLAQVESEEVKLPLHLFQLHIDINEDGQVNDSEDLSQIYGVYFGRDFAKGGGGVVVFDYADVQWLRGYTHLIRAMCESILAYDEKPLWNVISHRLFKQPQFHFDFVEQESIEAQNNAQKPRFAWEDEFLILDAIAAIHNLNFQAREPARLKRAHHHLKQTISQSRKMWQAVMSETDDDHEWIPNPNQTSMVSLTQISKEMVATWDEFLDEADAILDGKKLLPFWRGTDKTRGVNLFKVFHEPRDLDVILWIHGSGAVPFLENGDVTDRDTWNRFQRVYNGQLFSFATWFN